jgi:hypothetical protein
LTNESNKTDRTTSERYDLRNIWKTTAASSSAAEAGTNVAENTAQVPPPAQSSDNAQRTSDSLPSTIPYEDADSQATIEYRTPLDSEKELSDDEELAGWASIKDLPKAPTCFAQHAHGSTHAYSYHTLLSSSPKRSRNSKNLGMYEQSIQ